MARALSFYPRITWEKRQKLTAQNCYRRTKIQTPRAQINSGVYKLSIHQGVGKTENYLNSFQFWLQKGLGHYIIIPPLQS